MTATVLIVDDSTFIVEGLVAILKKNFRALPSFGGEECLAILRTEKPDNIVLDIMMEPMDGWETLSRIKENPDTRLIPVLMFSAKKISPEEAEAHRIRIDDFLTKPVNPRELVAAIEKILEREKRNKAILLYWAKAGYSRERIDEYLTISSNLEVDISLLAAMEKQLGHPTTSVVRRQDLATTITVLKDRIEQGRGAIDTFFQETGLTLPSPADIAEACEPVPEDVPADDITVPLAAPPEVIPTESNPPGPAGGGDTGDGEPISPLPGQQPAGPGGSLTRETETVPDQVPVSPEARVAAEDESPPGEGSPLPAGPSAGIADEGTAESAPKMQEPVEATPPDPDHTGWIPIPSHANPFTEGDTPVIDHLFETESAPETPGAGNPAQIPLPGVLRSGHGDGDRKKTPARTARPPVGLFSRIIAMITGLFGRGK